MQEEVSTEIIKRYRRDCIAVEQGFGSGGHGANAQFARPDGARIRRLNGCGTAHL